MKTSPRYKAKAAKTANEENVAQSLANYLRGQVKVEDLEEFVTEDFSKYVNDPVGFMRDILGFEPTEAQKDVCLSVMQNRSTVVESGHSLGKTKIAAGIGLFWLSTRQGVLVTSAPTSIQVNNLLWRQMRSMKNEAKKKLPGEIFQTPRWEFTDKSCYGLGISPRKDQDSLVAFQGHHHVNLLVILDEAAGLPKILFDAAASLATGEGNKRLAIGNPIAQTGAFYDITQSRSWKHFRMSCLDHPNVRAKKEIIPGAVSYGWVLEMLQNNCALSDGAGKNDFKWEGQYYRPNPVFLARVLGIPAEESEDQLIGYGWVDSAQARWEETESNGTYQGDRILGVDVGRHGEDDSIVLYRIGDHIKWIKRRHGNDVVETANLVIGCIKENNIDKVNIDDIGVSGGVVDIVKSQGFNARGVNVQHRAMQPTKFANVHDEMWFVVREKLRLGDMTLPKDEKLATDLVSMRIIGYDAQGRPNFESKELMKKRIGRSPDAGDALALSYAGEQIQTSGVTENYAEPLKSESRWGASGATSRWSVSTTSRKSDSRWRIR